MVTGYVKISDRKLIDLYLRIDTAVSIDLRKKLDEPSTYEQAKRHL